VSGFVSSLMFPYTKLNCFFFQPPKLEIIQNNEKSDILCTKECL